MGYDMTQDKDVKSDLFTINVEEDEARVFAQIFGCKLADFPFIYLGVPLHFSKLKKIRFTTHFR
jgi:hypothetical protein